MIAQQMDHRVANRTDRLFNSSHVILLFRVHSMTMRGNRSYCENRGCPFVRIRKRPHDRLCCGRKFAWEGGRSEGTKPSTEVKQGDHRMVERPASFQIALIDP